MLQYSSTRRHIRRAKVADVLFEIRGNPLSVSMSLPWSRQKHITAPLAVSEEVRNTNDREARCLRKLIALCHEEPLAVFHSYYQVGMENVLELSASQLAQVTALRIKCERDLARLQQ